MVNEYDKIDNLFLHMWQDCICELEYSTISSSSIKHNRVLMDAAKAKLEEVLEIVSDLMAERDDLKERLNKIREMAV